MRSDGYGLARYGGPTHAHGRGVWGRGRNMGYRVVSSGRGKNRREVEGQGLLWYTIAALSFKDQTSMAYKRKTRTPEELSAACRRAAMSWKHRRGGRPRAELNGRLSKSVKVSARHYETLAKCAAANGITIKRVVEQLVGVLVTGTNAPIKPHPQYAPADE